MANRVHEEDIKLNIIVSNNQAQKKIYDLEAANRKLREEQTELVKVKNRLEAQGKKESAEYKNAVTRLRQLKKEYSSNQAEIKKLTETMGVMGMTMAQLRSRANILRSSLNNMIPGSAKYKELQGELREITARMQQLNATAKAQSLTWSSAANWLNKYQTLLLGFVATVTGVTLTFQKWIDYAGELSDQQADVQKTTGMTRKEVDELTKSFGELETRTSRIDLLKIAEEGGRIGIAKDEMAEFVGVMDKASVALGDSFTGGVEEVASVLGKLKFLFEETKNLGVDQAYNAIGSAINDLGAAGVATERNIAEFATRLGSLQNQFKPTVAEALALGASFEESGIQAEIASRAYSIFLNRAAKNTSEFAKVLGISTEEAKALIDENPVEFFLQFGEALGKSSISATQMSKMLQDMGINADGANKIVGAISNNTQRFRDQINLSNKSMAEATSLTDEFGVKNTTLAATLDKINKTLAAWFSSETLMEWLKGAVEWFARLIGATEDADGSGKKWRNTLVFTAKILAVVAVALASNHAALKLVAIWTSRATAGSVLFNAQQRISAIVTALNTVRIQAWNVATNLMIWNLKGARQAFRAMSLAMSTTPWGALAAIIGVVVSSIILFRSETKKAAEHQQMLRDATNEARAAIKKEKDTLDSLLKIAKDQNQSLTDRQKAIKELNRLSPEYLGNLTLEKIHTEDATKAINGYIAALNKKQELDKFDRQRQKVSGAMDDINMDPKKSGYQGGLFTGGLEESFQEIYELEKSDPQLFKEKYFQWIVNPSGGRGTFAKRYKAYREEIQRLEELDGEIIKKRDEFLKNNASAFLGEDVDDSSYTPTEPEAKTKKSEKAKQERERRIQELIADNQKLNDELKRLRQENEASEIEMINEGWEKEKKQLEHERKWKIKQLEDQIVDEKTLNDLKTERNTAKLKADSSSGDTKKQYEEQIKLLDDFIGIIELKNQELSNSIINAQLTYQLKYKTANAKFATEHLKELSAEYESEKNIREQAFNMELVALGTTEAIKERLRGSMSKKELDKIKTWEDAKKALKKEYDEAEIEAEIDHLDELLQKVNEAMISGDFDGFNLKLLSEEDKEKFLQDIEKLKAKLIELGVAKADLQNGTGESTGSLGEVSIAGNTDILGMSPEAWETFIENIDRGKFELEELTAVVGMLQSAFATYYAYVQAQEQRNMALFDQNTNRKRTALKRQLDSGMISQEQYDKKLQKLEEEAEKRKAIMEYEGAMRAWRMNIANAVVSAAMATLNGFNSTPFLPVGLAMGALAATLGTIQVATVMKNKPVKGFEEGYYPDELFDVVREQDGKSFRASYGGRSRSGLVNSPTMFLAGEGGQYMPEMIISGNDWKNFHPDLRNDIIRSIAGVRGYEQGYYPNVDSSSGATPSADVEELKALIAQNSAVMAASLSVIQELRDQGVQAFIVPDFEQMRTWKKTEEDYTIHQSKNRV